MTRQWMIGAAMMMAISAAHAEKKPYQVWSYTAIARSGNPVTFRVVANSKQKSHGVATYADNVIHVNWKKLREHNASPQFVQFVLAHEAGHLIMRDRGIGSESTADFYAGKMLRLAGFTADDMATLQRDMLRIYGGGDDKHPGNSQRVMVLMRGYNSTASRAAPLVSATLEKFGKQLDRQ